MVAEHGARLPRPAFGNAIAFGRAGPGISPSLSTSAGTTPKNGSVVPRKGCAGYTNPRYSTQKQFGNITYRLELDVLINFIVFIIMAAY